MSSIADIEAALEKLSAEDLAHIERVLQRLRSESAEETRFDGQRWPETMQERNVLIGQLDSLPPLLQAEEADRFDAWQAAEKERQKALMEKAEPGSLFT
jgi:protein involved in temperature-dependent protein secretion